MDKHPTLSVMLELTRCVRCCVTADPAEETLPVLNAFSAWPPIRGLGLFVEMQLTCRGQPDPSTGYFLDIRTMDAAVRKAALPRLRAAVAGPDPASAPLGALLAAILADLQPQVGGSATRLQLALSPRHHWAVSADAMHTLEIRQSYEFAAAHRLGIAGADAERNRAVFGKCAHPAGHGHNYLLEVTVASAVGADGQAEALRDPTLLDRWVKEAVLDPFDHTFLNVDVPEFTAGLNPSVEHITRVCWRRLAAAAPAGVRLREVAVWETGKTRCAVRGEEVG